MRVLVISGSRADYGSIEAVYEALKRYGVHTVFITLPADLDQVGENYDLVIVEGDRFEILKAVVEIFLQKVPIVHLGGGDLTEGSQDDSMRHAITKLSHLHYATCYESAKRIIQMGDEAWRVKVVGEPAVDSIPELYGRKEVLVRAGLCAGPTIDYEPITKDIITVLFHPDTLGNTENEVKLLVSALESLNEDFAIVVIGPNRDSEYEYIEKAFRNMVMGWINEGRHNVAYTSTLDRKTYLSLLAQSSCLVGNSSSGYFEAPSLGTPVVDIGTRQKGRIKSSNIINCDYDKILEAIDEVMKKERVKLKNPYYTGSAADQIAKDIARMKDPRKLLLKRFYTIKH